MVSIAEKMLLLLSGSAQQTFVTATTTTDGESVTINRLTPASGSLVIDWGDGDTTTVNAGDTASKSHTYASAGSYAITVDDYDNIQQIRLESSKLDGFNTALLANAPVTYFVVGNGTNFVINSSDMSSWTPSTWFLYSMPSGGTYTINTSDMSSWTPATWWLFSMPSGGTYTINSSDMSSWNTTNWRLYSMPSGGTYTINTSDLSSWNPTSWRLFSMPSGTYTINTSDLSSWNPTIWWLYSMPSGTYTFAAANFSSWVGISDLRAQDNGFSTAQVDEIITGMHGLISTNTQATPSVDVGGTNAAPSASPEIDTYIPALQSDGWTITYTTP